jgi:hypothetical protein
MLCFRLVKTLPCIAVFMSSLTIVVIAIDRYLVICRPTHKQVRLMLDMIVKYQSQNNMNIEKGK